ncbi:MAG TPA: cytidylate kinase-like family protein [Candidatus Angelobacter sp.]|nr:cytidylate kinase-like family protein [Candidatus Angelobacter sp.]
MVRIITIEREYGSGGGQIAAKVATRLGWELWDQTLTQEIARLAHCHESTIQKHEERRDPLYHRLLKSFSLGSYEGNFGIYPMETLDAEKIMKISQQVVEKAAASGNCVIVGRGAQHFLQDRTDTLRFFLYAPRESKIQRLISEGTSRTHAEALVERVDRERAAYIRNYFHAAWPNRSVYHAMINTANGDQQVVNAILSFLDIQSRGLAAD